MYLASLAASLLVFFIIRPTRTHEGMLQQQWSREWSHFPNHSYVTLACRAGGIPADDGVLLWNNSSNVSAIGNVCQVVNGSMTFLLTQQTEGYFACVTMSNQIALAGKRKSQEILIVSGVLIVASLILLVALILYCAIRLSKPTIQKKAPLTNKNTKSKSLDTLVLEPNPSSGYETTPSPITCGTPNEVSNLPSFEDDVFIDDNGNDNDHDTDLEAAISSMEVLDDISLSPNQFVVQETVRGAESLHFRFASHTPSFRKRPKSFLCSSPLECQKILSMEHSSHVETPDCPTSLAWCTSPPEHQKNLSRKGCSSDIDTPQYIMRPKSLACSTPSEDQKTLQCCESRGSECPKMPCQELQTRKPVQSPVCVKKVTDPGLCVPAWMHRIHVLRNCTERGVRYRSKSYGFTLDIPEEAIPQGMSLTIDLGISLHGPFRYPENVQRVSPIVWICVRNEHSFRFLKQVQIILQHCLEVDDTVSLDRLGLQFLKAGHTPDQAGNFSFLRSDGSVAPSSAPNYLTLSTDHFCYMCIVSNVSQETLDKMQYCLCPFYPQPIVREENDIIHFYVSFFLNACLKTIRDQTGKELKRASPRRFSFSSHHSGEKCLKIELSQPENWVLSLMCNEEMVCHAPHIIIAKFFSIVFDDNDFKLTYKIYPEDVAFLQKDGEQLHIEQEQGMYPPKFTVHVCSDSVVVKSSKVHVDFLGANRKIALDVPLQTQMEGSDPKGFLTPEPYTPERRKSLTPEPYTPSSPYRERVMPIPLNTFMEYVAVHVRTKWRFFGIMVEIPADILDSFPAHDCLQCFVQVFHFWVRRGTPSVSWEQVVNVLESGTVDEKTLAEDIRKTFLSSVLPPRLGDEGHSTPSEFQKSKSSDSGYGSTTTTCMMVSDV